MIHTIRHSVFVSLFVVMLLVAGCSTLNVQHLAPQPWSVQQTTFQHMKFWNFEYVCSLEQETYRIKGSALPCSDDLPTWGKWLSELQFTVYLCDVSGAVLAVRDIHILPGIFSRDQRIPFAFDIPARNVPSPASITFGYRMVLLPCDPPSDQVNGQKIKNTHVFFAHQGALRQ